MSGEGPSGSEECKGEGAAGADRGPPAACSLTGGGERDGSFWGVLGSVTV